MAARRAPRGAAQAGTVVNSAEHLESLASLLEKEQEQDDVRLAAELRRKAEEVRGAKADRPKAPRLAGVGHKHAREKVAKVQKRIEGYQHEADKLRARLIELDRLLAAASVDLVKAEAKVELERASLIRQGLLGGDMGEALRHAIEVPADMRGTQIEAQLHGVAYRGIRPGNRLSRNDRRLPDRQQGRGHGFRDLVELDARRDVFSKIEQM